MARPHIVVVGAGFGGLAVARSLSGAEVDVTVVDQRNHHTFQPLLYQVATAGLDADEVCYTTRGVFSRQRNARALQATVTGVDLDAKTVSIDGGAPLRYDTVVLAAGAVTADFGVDGVAEHAFGLKSAAEAVEIRDHVLRRFERAAQQQVQASAAMTVVIVGGGPTGVEMAGGFAELFERVLTRDFPELGDHKPRVVLVEGQNRLLGSFHERLGANARDRLERMGVEVRLGAQVEAVRSDSVSFADGEHLATDTVIWAAGVRAHPLAELLGVELTRGGRVVVDDHLRVPGRADVFVIGDLAAATLDDGTLVPQVAPGAIQAGQHVALQLKGEAPGPFRYRDKGSMATIGRNAAVVELPNGRRITGFAGWVAWLALHLVMLVGFRNRANVLVNWAWNYLTYDRASRSIIE